MVDAAAALRGKRSGGVTENASGKVTSVNTFDVLFNKATPYEVPHILLAAYSVAGFLVASGYE